MTAESLRQSDHRGRLGVLFYLFAGTLLYCIFFLGMPVAQEGLRDHRYRDVFLLLAGVLGLIGGLRWGSISNVRPESSRPEDRLLTVAAVVLPLWVLLQWLPLPVRLVAVLSPTRAAMSEALNPLLNNQPLASLSLSPAATFWHFLLICAYSAMFFAAREYTVRARRVVWNLALPLLVGAVFEIALGIWQLADSSDSPLKGTFPIRNHLAGFLELSAPFAAGLAMDALRIGAGRSEAGQRNVGLGVVASIVSLMALMVGLLTLSRGGFLGLLGSALAFGVLAAGRSRRQRGRLVVLAAAAGVMIVIFTAAAPASLIARLGQHDSEGRTTIWAESVGVIREFPVFGAGVGGFESAFLKYKAAEGRFVVDYAHNDYLQGCAELGLPGFLVVSCLIGCAVLRSLRLATGGFNRKKPSRGSRDHREGDDSTRWMALSCLSALVAILIHSFVDFNLYVPANTASVAWICGIAAGLLPPRAPDQSVEVNQSLHRRAP